LILVSNFIAWGHLNRWFFGLTYNHKIFFSPQILYMNNNLKIAAAAAIGASVGIIAGVLLAPEKGSDIRKKMVDRGKKLVTDIKELSLEGKKVVEGISSN
jgi:hypothetical protein